MKKVGLLIGLAFLLGLSTTASAQNPDAIVGTWLNGDRDAHIEISKGEGGKYFGKIVWLQNPVYPADDKKGMVGRTKVDRENPDHALRNRPILGLMILRDFKFSGGNLWDQGRVYDPKNGKDYKCKLTLKNADNLDVRGFIGFSLLGRTDSWTRVKGT